MRDDDKENLNKINNCKSISIGPITSSTAKELNIDIYKQASKATIDSIIEAIIKD